jgi:hypothetical protein
MKRKSDKKEMGAKKGKQKARKEGPVFARKITLPFSRAL